VANRPQVGETRLSWLEASSGHLYVREADGETFSLSVVVRREEGSGDAAALSLEH